jgi:hypothetical protein
MNQPGIPLNSYPKMINMVYSKQIRASNMLIVDALFIILWIALEKCFCFILFYLKFYDLKSRILSVFSMHINELINPILQRKFLLLPSVATVSKLSVFDHPNGRPNFF